MKKLFILALAIGIPLVIQSCEDEDPITPGPELSIGDFHEGGVIFYLDSTGEHGLVTTIIDQGFNIQWGCPSLLSFGAKGLELGTGAQNTLDVVTACHTPNIAASLCDTLTLNGYEDWFLPSRDELDSLFQHHEIVSETATEYHGSVLHDGEYWSSSHYQDNTVWIQHLSEGNQSGALKDKEFYVRAIRSF